MHELALAQSLFDIIEKTARENGGGRVEAATLRIGAMTHVDPESLSFAFEVLSRDTLAEGCHLYIEKVPLAIRCPSCGFFGEISPESAQCPSCGGVGLAVTGGREIELKSIDLEDVPNA